MNLIIQILYLQTGQVLSHSSKYMLNDSDKGCLNSYILKRRRVVVPYQHFCLNI